ncbi:myosin-9-like [Frankliniella occidentalis]|uniref:Myosin-9-like n=1 Tax=Frankliniella occidentalis TaxID=133901 RepID=A0A9C6U108_FRAOC|nr:myosin-9-like [Frankliniella occidentalis]XP_052121099.1 myosin-9-like [Frankliniella occidentalis]XP_052121104.1 myosin-9-like [Frankliniella occidentalis]
MEMESPAAARACKRTASPDSGQQAEKRCFVVQDDAAAAVGGLVRQGTFTKEDVGSGSEQIFIPVEHKENASRREALRIRFAEREQSRRSARKLTEARGTAAPRRPATKDESTATGRSVRARQAPVSGVSGLSPLQRQGTFTVDEEAGRADGQSGDLMDPGDDGGQAQQAVNEVASDNSGTVRDGDAVAAEVAALRASVAALRRGERVARERAARDAGRTRAALQDVHGRLAATRAALQAEKEALLHKLTDREALWRQERDRAQAQVRALETEARALRAQLSSKQADAVRKVTAAEAELRRAAHDQEAALRAQLADMARQRDSLQAQLRDRTLPERPASPASPAARPQEEWQRVALAQRRELQQGRKRQAQLEAQLREARRPQDALREADLKGDLARALHAKDEERRRDAAEAARKHEALEAQLRDALRELRQQREAASRRPAARSGAGRARALALESQVDGETRTGPDGSGEARGAPGSEPLRTTPATPPNARCRPHQREQRGGAAVGRKRRRWAEDEEEDDNKRTLNEATHKDNDDDENENQRRSLLREVERLREHNTALRESLRVRRRRSPRPPGPQRVHWCACSGVVTVAR